MTGVKVLLSRCTGKVDTDVLVNGIDVSGMTTEASEHPLREALAHFEVAAVPYTFSERSWAATLAQLGMAVDYRCVIDFAMG